MEEGIAVLLQFKFKILDYSIYNIIRVKITGNNQIRKQNPKWI